MTNYMPNGEWSGWKRKLTIAKKKGPDEVLAVCSAFFKRETEDGVCLPDDWSLFQRAQDDAEYAHLRGRPVW